MNKKRILITTILAGFLSVCSFMTFAENCGNGVTACDRCGVCGCDGLPEVDSSFECKDFQYIDINCEAINCTPVVVYSHFTTFKVTWTYCDDSEETYTEYDGGSGTCANMYDNLD